MLALTRSRFRTLSLLLLSCATFGCGSDSGSPLPVLGPVPGGNGGSAATALDPTTPVTPSDGGTSGETTSGEGAPLDPGAPLPTTPGAPGTAMPPVEPLTPNSAGYVWRAVAMGGGGFVSGIITSPEQQNLIFARTDVGGAYRWNEASGAWISISDWVSENEVGLLGVESLAIDPQEPARVYMLAGISYFNGGRTAILASTDYGNTFSVHEVTAQFTAHGNGAGRQNGERLVVDPRNGAILFTGTREDGLFRSTDHGASWTRVVGFDVTTTPTGSGTVFVMFDPVAASRADVSDVLYAGVSRSGSTNLFVSRDAGETWAAVPGQPTDFMPQRAAFDAAGNLYITYGNGAGPNGTTANPMDRGAVWKRSASGDWTEITPLRAATNRAFGGISVSAEGTRIVVSTINTYLQQPWNYGDRIFSSDDGGGTWTDLIAAGRVEMDTNGTPWIEDHAMHWVGSIELDPHDPERLFATSGNGVFMTEALSAPISTWKMLGKGMEETVPVDAVSIPGGPLVSVIRDYDGFVHDDVTESPAAGVHQPEMGTTDGLAFAHNQPDRVARVGTQLYLSNDGGRAWSLVQRPSAATGGRLAFTADGSALLWSAGGAVQRTENGGASWAPVNGLAFTAAISADTVNPNKLYAYDPNGGSFYVSADAGRTFTASAALGAQGAARSRAVPGHEGDVWVALYGRGLTRSTNSGASFNPVGGVEQCAAVGFGAPAPGQSYPAVYIWGRSAGVTGIHRSNDAGSTWLRINDDAHEYGGPGNGQFVIGDANVYGRVFMSTAGRGIVYGEIAATP